MHPQPETYWGHVNPIGPRGVYDEAKRYAEALTMAYHRQQGVDTAIVRIFNTYGPRMRRTTAARSRRSCARRCRTGRSPCSATARRRARSATSTTRSAGMIALAESGYHDPVNIGNPDEFTLLELAETVIEVTGSRSEIVFEALPTDDPQVRQPDITLAREILGWEPEVEPPRGARAHDRAVGREALVGVAR